MIRPHVRLVLAWAAVGLLWGLTCLSMLTIGIFVLPLAMFAAWYATRQARWTGAVGSALCGVAALPTFVAIMNREGPGTVCHSGPNWTSCSTHASPWPWAAAAVVLFAAGVTLIVRTIRHS
jgi:hypothetical protein